MKRVASLVLAWLYVPVFTICAQMNDTYVDNLWVNHAATFYTTNGSVGMGAASPEGLFEVFSGGQTPVSMVPCMTSGTAPSGTVFGTESTIGCYLWKAFNDTLDHSNWQNSWAVQGSSGIIGYQFGSGKSIVQYALTSRGEGAPRSPKTWTFQGSNNGTNYTTLDAQSNIMDWACSPWVRKVFPLSNTNSYAYYRVNITETGDEAGDGPYVGLGLIEMYALSGSLPVSKFRINTNGTTSIKDSVSISGNAVIASNLTVNGVISGSGSSLTGITVAQISGLGTAAYSNSAAFAAVGHNNHTITEILNNGRTLSGDEMENALYVPRSAGGAALYSYGIGYISAYGTCQFYAESDGSPNWWDFNAGTGHRFMLKDSSGNSEYVRTNHTGTVIISGSAGKLGIGIAPVEQLHVNGNAIITTNLMVGNTITAGAFYGSGAFLSGITAEQVGALTQQEADQRYIIGASGVASNITLAGCVTLDSNAVVYIPPQGGLSMGSFTNGPAQ